jgi:hypothetical protein
MSEPLIKNTTINKVIATVISAVITTILAFMLNAVLNIESNGRLILEDIETFKDWRSETNQELHELNGRIDNLYQIVVEDHK